MIIYICCLFLFIIVVDLSRSLAQVVGGVGRGVGVGGVGGERRAVRGVGERCGVGGRHGRGVRRRHGRRVRRAVQHARLGLRGGHGHRRDASEYQLSENNQNVQVNVGTRLHRGGGRGLPGAQAGRAVQRGVHGARGGGVHRARGGRLHRAARLLRVQRAARRLLRLPLRLALRRILPAQVIWTSRQH
ncbi:unnamed protein product [Chrysodeixis includens]|uniref:Uncharacterized protein n=1 Tax=Chrysodeixis includens TaxID=689277 RepID=A0A9N8L2L1_CHRIL|nr:unnamed protein product [Chrysodeixis includens]